MIKKISVLCVGFVALIGCQDPSKYRPIVKRPGPDYEIDLAQCQQRAKNGNYVNAESALGALAGAGTSMAMFGGNSFGYGGGGMAGQNAAFGFEESKNRQIKNAIVQCIKDKGYDV